VSPWRTVLAHAHIAIQRIGITLADMDAHAAPDPLADGMRNPDSDSELSPEGAVELGGGGGYVPYGQTVSDSPMVGPGGYLPRPRPRHVMGCIQLKNRAFNARVDDAAGNTSLSPARHVIGCHLTQTSSVQTTR